MRILYQKRKRKPIYDERTGEPPTEDQIERMTAQAKRVVEYWIASRDHSRKELYEKIKRKGITDQVADEVLDHYEEKGWINDENFAELFVNSKIRYEKYGRQALKYKLREKGVSQDIIDKVLEEIEPETEEENARSIALKKALSTQKVEHQKRVNQIVGMLVRKGYGSNVWRIAQEAIEEADADLTSDET